MPVWTIEVGGLPVQAFNAGTKAEAEEWAGSPALGGDLLALRLLSGDRVWDGQAPISVRPAENDEQQRWEVSRLCALEAGDLGAENFWVHYLVSLQDDLADELEEDEDD